MLRLLDRQAAARHDYGMWHKLLHYELMDGRLIGSEYPGAVGGPDRVVQELMADGQRTAMITLTPAFRQYRCPRLTQIHCPLANLPDRSRIEAVVAMVHQHLARGDRVWVHCQRGIDRTGCVIGSYLVCAGRSPDEVIELLVRQFPAAWQSPRMLQLWRPSADLIRSFAGHRLPAQSAMATPGR
jgi:hypothetical protein